MRASFFVKSASSFAFALALASCNSPTAPKSKSASNSPSTPTAAAAAANSGPILIAEKQSWKYFDKGTDLGTAWRASSYNDTTWSSGAAKFGYGYGDESTIVSYGSSASNKYITTYFRKTFSVSNPSTFSSLVVNMSYDDGAIIYINGVEARRINMPLGVVNYQTLAVSAISQSTKDYVFIDPSLLVSGDNVIAVEIHQSAANSSDIGFDLSLTGQKNTVVSNGSVYFQHDFEGTSLSARSSRDYVYTGWSIRSVPGVDDFYATADASYIEQYVTPDPTGSGRSVLYAHSVNDDASNSVTRAQTALEFLPGTVLPVYHTSHRIYLHPDLNQLTQYSGMISGKGTSDWFTFFEIWNEHNSAWDGDIGGVSRWSFGFHKEAGVGQPLSWEVTSELMQPAAVTFNEIWPMQKNAFVPVPIGQWVTFDVYVVRGEDLQGTF